MCRITETTKRAYEDYLVLLQKEGFGLYDKNTIGKNEFSTFVGKDLLIHVYYTGHDDVVRIVADPNTTLYKKKKEDFETLYSTTLYQLELDYKNIDCGMCYITQCEDGSFFMVDSAHMNSEEDHHRIHALLRQLTPAGKKIVIAGWFFTHAHQDHIAKFMDFLRFGYDDVVIESLYYNFPALSVLGSDRWTESDKQTMREFDELILQHANLSVIKLHTGQKIHIRNLEFEVLATHEDIYPGDLACYNDSSCILQMRVEGSKVMFLGDSNYTECQILIDRYGDYLKSDIVQVAHHGYNKDNVKVYSYIDARVALYATRQNRYEEVQDSPSNKVIKEISKELYIAGNGTVSLKLPYEPNSAIVFSQEVNTK